MTKFNKSLHVAITIFIFAIVYIAIELITRVQVQILKHNIFLGLALSALVIFLAFYTSYYLYEKYKQSKENKYKEV